jgi:hypothetical protein
VLNRWLAGAIAVAAFALVAMPTAGETPAPPCPAGAQVAPDRLEFTEEPDTSPTQSVAATHPTALFIGVDGASLTAVTDPAIQIAGPPDVALTREDQYDDTTHLKVDFTPTVPGPLTFTATWTQLTAPGGSPCTASASATVAVTAPTVARASRQLGYTVDHRQGKAGRTNEFTLSARVISDPRHGDRSPIRIVVRAVASMHRPSAGAPSTTVTLDPLKIPKAGARASSRLVRVRAGPYADEPFIYEFRVGVLAYPPHGRGRARRGVEITLSQRSKTLATFRFVTSCSAPIGGLQCTPLPKEAPRP